MHVLTHDTGEVIDSTVDLALVSGGCHPVRPPFYPMPPQRPPFQRPSVPPSFSEPDLPSGMTLEDYIRQINELAEPYMDTISPLQTRPPVLD